jgi:quercetin dioxygenase-like cupin family protein
LFIVLAYAVSVSAQTGLPKPFLVQLSDTTSDYQRVFAGPPQTTSMHSGLVVIAPTKSVGKHSTKSYEEAIVVLSGTGEFKITGGPTLQLSPNSVLYCPPNKEHDVVNTGTTPLRYLYIAAKQK